VCLFVGAALEECLVFSSRKLNLLQGFADVQRCNFRAFQAFFHLYCLKRVYFAPAAFEAGFISQSTPQKQDLIWGGEIFFLPDLKEGGRGL